MSISCSFTGSLCAKIEVDIEAEPVSPQLVAAAIKSGVGLRSRQKPLRPSKFVAAYLQKLTYSYEEDKVNEEMRTAWKEVLLCLEERGRKLVMVADERVALTLFCPTVDSRKQLYESPWIERLTESLGNLVKLFGNVILFGIFIDHSCGTREGNFSVLFVCFRPGGGSLGQGVLSGWSFLGGGGGGPSHCIIGYIPSQPRLTPRLEEFIFPCIL